MRAREIQPNKLVIFDIDDTLVKTDTKVNVIKDGRVIKRLNSHDFTHYKLEPGESFDFGAFKDAREFFEKAKPILPMIGQLKRDIDTGNKVIMVTAREDFNDRDIFLDTFKRFGIDMSKVHVYRAGNIKDKISTEEKKKIIIRKVLDSNDYTKAIMYDDAIPNLELFLSLKDSHPNVKFYAWYVNPKGQAVEMGRTNESLSTPVSEVVNKELWHPERMFQQRVPIGDYEFEAKEAIGGMGDYDADALTIIAYDPRLKKNKQEIGHVNFVVKGRGSQRRLVSDDTYVNPKYRGEGIATMMYAYAKSLGNDIKGSNIQTPMGKQMWAKWGQDAEHLKGNT